MPFFPVLPQKQRNRRAPSLAFRRIFLTLVLLFITISGLVEFQLQQSSDIPRVVFQTPLIQKAYGEKQANKFSAIDSATGQTAVATMQVKQIAIGIKKVVPTQTHIPTGTSNASDPWGVAKQIDADTWTMKVGQDPQAASPQEILSALNVYRQQHGRGILSWDQKLADFANQRASYFISINKLDNHAGFLDYVHNQDGFHKLGYAAIGENSSIGYTLSGVHLIEWIYGGDKPHDDNQLSSQWQYVGIGVNASATDLVFAGSRL